MLHIGASKKSEIPAISAVSGGRTDQSPLRSELGEERARQLTDLFPRMVGVIPPERFAQVGFQRAETWDNIIRTLNVYRERSGFEHVAAILKKCVDWNFEHEFVELIGSLPWEGTPEVFAKCAKLAAHAPDVAAKIIQAVRNSNLSDEDAGSWLDAFYEIKVCPEGILPLRGGVTADELTIFRKALATKLWFALEGVCKLRGTCGFVKSVEKINSILDDYGEAFWGLAYSLGDGVFSLTPEEKQQVLIGKSWDTRGLATLYALVPRNEWLNFDVRRLCSRYDLPGCERLARGERIYQDLDNVEHMAKEDWLKQCLGIRFLHRYIVAPSNAGDDQWRLLDRVKSTYERLAAGGPMSPHGLILVVFPGYDPYDPSMYEHYAACLADLPESHDLLFIEVESASQLLRIREKFRRDRIPEPGALPVLTHGGYDSLVLSHVDVEEHGDLLLDRFREDSSAECALARWIAPGGLIIIEGCQSSQGTPGSSNILWAISCAAREKQAICLGSIGTGYLTEISASEGRISVGYSDLKLLVKIDTNREVNWAVP